MARCVPRGTPKEVYRRYCDLYYKKEGGGGNRGLNRAWVWYRQMLLDRARRARPKTRAGRAEAREEAKTTNTFEYLQRKAFEDGH